MVTSRTFLQLVHDEVPMRFVQTFSSVALLISILTTVVGTITLIIAFLMPVDQASVSDGTRSWLVEWLLSQVRLYVVLF